MDFSTQPPEFNDQVTQGASYLLPVQVLDSAGTPVPLTNAFACWTWYDNTGAIGFQASSNDSLVINGPQGVIYMEANGIQTMGLQAGRYQHSLMVKLFNGPSIQYLEGVMQVNQYQVAVVNG